MDQKRLLGGAIGGPAHCNGWKLVQCSEKVALIIVLFQNRGEGIHIERFKGFLNYPITTA
jgi:hypothetical protein